MASFGGGPNVNSRGTATKGGDLYQGRSGKVRSVVGVHVNTLRGSRLGGSRTSSQHFQVMVEAAREGRAPGGMAGGYPT